MTIENETPVSAEVETEADAQDSLSREEREDDKATQAALAAAAIDGPVDASEEKLKRKKQAADAPYGRFFLIEPEKLVIVGLDTKLEVGETHPLADPQRIHKPLEERFVQYMDMVGFDSVIAVCKNGDVFEVVKGRQRVKTAREVNRRRAKDKNGKPPLRVKCEISRDSGELHATKKFGENAHKIVNSPLEVARDINTYMASGYSEEEASIVFNTSVANLKGLLKLLDLDPVIQRAVERGAVAATSVAPLAKLTREMQRHEFEKMNTEVANGGDGSKTGGKVRGAAKKAKAAAKAAAAKKKGDDTAEAIVPPGKRLVTKMLELNKKDGGSGIDPMFVKGALWILGDISTKGAGVKGLTALENKAKAAKAEKDAE